MANENEEEEGRMHGFSAACPKPLVSSAPPRTSAVSASIDSTEYGWETHEKVRVCGKHVSAICFTNPKHYSTMDIYIYITFAL